MDKKQILMLSAALSFVFSPVFSLTSDTTPSTSTESGSSLKNFFTSDSTIKESVKTALMNARENVKDVSVDVNNGVVQLNGTVPSETTKSRVEMIAKRIAGDRTVINNLTVKSGMESTGFTETPPAPEKVPSNMDNMTPSK